MQASAYLGFVLLISLNTGAGAQHAPTGIAGPGPSALLGAAVRGPLRQSLVPDSVWRDIQPTHWKEGALIGGVSVGLGMAILASGFCRSSDNGGDCGGTFTLGLLAGGVLGGLVGALIGGQFPKAEDP
jgi:hypothetical protein